MNDPSSTSTPPRATIARLAVPAALGTFAALCGTTLIHLAARVADLELVVTPPGQPTGEVPYGAVLGAVLVSGAAAFVGAWILGCPRRGSRWFVGLATLALVGSFASPLGAAEETSTAIVLGLMHVVVAVALVPLLARRMKEGER